jgi:hypothetical protein
VSMVSAFFGLNNQNTFVLYAGWHIEKCELGVPTS